MKKRPIFKIFVLLASIAITGGCTYWGRVIFYNTSDIDDYKKFPERIVSNAPPIFNFNKSAETGVVEAAFDKTGYMYKNRERKMPLEDFLARTHTTAFIVIKDDAILYEGYLKGYKRDSINASFSMAKSFTSALVGIAIDEGLIKSVGEPITKYLPELKGRGLDKVTIKNLLCMNSGAKYSIVPDDTRAYYEPDLRKAALQIEPEGAPGDFFEYNNYHPLLLGIILERVTGVTVSKYLEEKIWKKIGAEFPAAWSLDSEKSGFEKMGSSISARAIDFAKFGRLFINDGRTNDAQIVSAKWVSESITRDKDMEGANYYRSDKNFSKYPNMYYKYMWWGFSGENGDYDFMALGHLGQIIFVSPTEKIIIVRFGKKYGEIDSWPALFQRLAAEL